jgi:hypothetical protein
MKRLRKLLAILMVSTLFMSLMTITASAVNYTTVAGGTTNFNKYLIIEDGATVPNKTFSFTIAPGSAVAATASTMAVTAGPAGATVGTVTFAPADTINTDTTGSVTGTANNKYAVKTVTADFTGVNFPEPGVYRYVITESAATAPYAIASDNPLYMDVYVVDNGNGLAVDSYVLHTSTAAPALGNDAGTAGGALADKTDGFINTYDTSDLTVSKDVSGNQASKDKYFQITVTVPGLTTTDSFNVDIDDAEAAPTANTATTYNSMSNPDTVTGAQLASGVNFYLQHGQSVKIEGLPTGATYTVEEVKEEYEPALTITGGSSSTVEATNDEGSGTLSSDVTAAFTNTRDGVIPTGVLLTIAPFAVGILLFGAMFIFMVSKRRREAY